MSPVPDPALNAPAPCPTCQNGHTRQTTGMVCQTCGRDYGAAADRLGEIEARLAAASRLPWMKDPDDPDKVLHSTNGGFDGYVIATVQRDDFGLFEEANTDLIAHAPEDLAALLAVVKAVRDLRNRARRAGPLEALTRDSLIRCLNAALHTLEDES